MSTDDPDLCTRHADYKMHLAQSSFEGVHCASPPTDSNFDFPPDLRRRRRCFFAHLSKQSPGKTRAGRIAQSERAAARRSFGSCLDFGARLADGRSKQTGRAEGGCCMAVGPVMDENRVPAIRDQMEGGREGGDVFSSLIVDIALKDHNSLTD